MYRSLMALMEQVAGGITDPGNAEAISVPGEPPPPLSSAVKEKSCFLFAGDQLSRSSGLPDWTEFLFDLVGHLLQVHAITVEEAKSFRDCWEDGSYDRLAKMIRETAVRGDREAVDYARQVYRRAVSPSKVHAALARIPFCAALTPNLDKLLEGVLAWETLGPADGLTVQDRLAESLPFVLKLRACAGGSSSSFWPDESSGRLRKSCVEALQDLFDSRTMLAVGISPAELTRWLEAAGVSSSRPHYLVTTTSDEDVRNQAVALYRDFNVSVMLTTEIDSYETLSFLNRLDRTTI